MQHIRDTFKNLTTEMTVELAKLVEERDKLELDIKNLKNEREGPKNYNVDRVLLDIGGFQFSTSVHTLSSVPNTYFSKLFSNGFPSQMLNDEGRIFLDRDGRFFRYILNCLRDPQDFNLKLRGKQELDSLRKEAQFYGLEDSMFKNSIFVPEVQGWLDEKKIKLVAFSTEHSERFPATNVLDYSRTYWLSLPGTITDQWLTFDFGVEAYISKISVKVDNFECTVKDFSLQCTDDDDYKSENWTTLKDFQAKVGNSCQEEQFFDGFEFRGRYMRFFCKNNWGPGGGNFILITNIKFYGALSE
jgi:hypothetical protein